MIVALLHNLSLLDALQRERAAALAEGSRHDQWAPLVWEETAEKTHEVLTLAQKNTDDFWSLLSERFFTAFAQRNNRDFRLSQPRAALMDWYQFNLEQPTHQLALSLLTNQAGFSPAQTSALVHYIASYLFLAQLRDRGLMIMLKADIQLPEITLMKNLALSCSSRERLFLGLADEKLRQWIDEAKAPSLTAIGQMDQTLRKLKDGFAKGVIAQSTLSGWIGQFNEELAQRHDALHKAILKLDAQTRESAGAGAMLSALESDVETQWNTIKTLPLFRGLSDSTLRGLLKGAKLLSVEKNATLFTQGEPIGRFYIMLDGLARTAKAAPDGQECIFQLLTKKDCVIDQGLSTGMIAPFSFKAVGKCRVLSLALPLLLDHLSRNLELAQNLLAAATQRLQRLCAQYEQITLRSAEHRVGWFLVNLHLETGLEGEPLTLPFDKALIAAYLNIKPETFSRVLAHFRKQGFIIEKHRVVMPNPQALCRYCEPEMALRCCRAEAENCAPIQIARRAGGLQGV